jgi:hypothetical protein
MKHILKPLVCIGLIAFTGGLHAQALQEDSQKIAGNFALAYSGIAENGYRTGYINTPYYPEEYTAGSFCFRDMEYRNVKMRIDCYTQRLVILTPDENMSRVVHPAEVKRATIGGTPFVYFGSTEAIPGEGYYAALYEGEDFSVYSLHYVNNLIQKVQGKVMLRGFSLKERVFLVKDGQWTALSGKGSFIKHFKAHKEALNSYCKEKKLLFKKGNHSDWSALAAYCETLIRK